MTAAEDRRSVVVVGAGLAGLTAAHDLRERDPLVLEAEEWIGGRSRHGEHGGVRDTFGAEGWYDHDPDTPERRVLAEVGVRLAPVGGRTALGVGARLAAPESVEELIAELALGPAAAEDLRATQARVREAAHELGEPDPDGARLRPLLAQTAAEWLGECEPEVSSFYRNLFASEFAAGLEDVPALFFLSGLPPYGGAEGGGWGEFLAPPGGCADICAALAATLPTAPLTGARVIEISQSASACTVAYEHEDTIRTVEAERVVVATPPGVVARIVANLAQAKRAALASIRAYPIVEASVLLSGDGPAPWTKLSAAWTPDLAFSMCLHAKTDDPRPDGRTVVHLLAIGPWAEALGRHSDEEVLARFVADFESAFPVARGRVESRVLLRWEEGATMPLPGYDRHVPALLAPVGRIHFAGDHVGFADADAPGGVGRGGRAGELAVTVCVHTAMRSGLRAAAQADGRAG